jgi:predicted phage terminase large subunit-like protein
LATYPQYKSGWFHRRLAAELDQFLRDVNANRRPRLIICAPPQHGKSELVSRRFPGYALGANPDLRIIATSHTAALAQRFSTELQRIMESEAYHRVFPHTQIAARFANAGRATRRSDFWEVVGHRGSYRAAGVEGAITGMGADILIVDDPIKDEEAANSIVTRNKIWDWFTSTAYTRLSNGGGVVIIMTRWHEDDLVGRLLAAAQQNGEEYKLVSFPAIAEIDEPNRRAGEPLSVERFSLDSLRSIQRTLGCYKWAALYQQRPGPAEGAIIKREWIKFCDDFFLPTKFDEIVQSWDCAFKDTAGSDFVAGHVWGRAGNKFYFLARVHARMDFPATLDAMREVSARWPQATAKLVEDKANGPAVVQMLSKELTGVIAVEPQGSKRSRMHAVAPLFEAGNVLVAHPRIAPEIEEVIAEWVSFPYGAHDDDCDAMTQALLRLKLHPDYGPPPFIIG